MPGAMFAGSRSMRNRKLGAARIRSRPRWMPARSRPRSGRPCRTRAASGPPRRSPAGDRPGGRASREFSSRTALRTARAGRPADEHLAAARRVDRGAAPRTDRRSGRSPRPARRNTARSWCGQSRAAAAAGRLRAPSVCFTNDTPTSRVPAFTGTRTSSPASAVCMYTSHSGSPCVLPAKLSGAVMPLPSPPTVNRLMSAPSRRTSIWCGSPIPIRYRYNCRFSTTLMLYSPSSGKDSESPCRRATRTAAPRSPDRPGPAPWES